MRVLDRGGDAMLTATDVFPGDEADSRVKEVKHWLNSKGVRDFEPVSLFCDQLKKARTSSAHLVRLSHVPHRKPSRKSRSSQTGSPT